MRGVKTRTVGSLRPRSGQRPPPALPDYVYVYVYDGTGHLRWGRRGLYPAPCCGREGASLFGGFVARRALVRGWARRGNSPAEVSPFTAVEVGTGPCCTVHDILPRLLHVFGKPTSPSGRCMQLGPSPVLLESCKGLHSTGSDWCERSSPRRRSP